LRFENALLEVKTVSSQAYNHTGRPIGSEVTHVSKRVAESLGGRRPRVLVAEDHDDTREALRLLLELQGYEVVVARDGEEALDVAMESPPDVIITDYDMPRMDGAAFARELRSRSLRFASIPILVLTALNQSMVEKALVAGADAYISKPVDFVTLQATLSSFVRR
jgi:two-component system, OmpR family, KDP operon response regulator KdpE